MKTDRKSTRARRGDKRRRDVGFGLEWPQADDPLTAAFDPLVPLAELHFRFRHRLRARVLRARRPPCSQAALNDKSEFRSGLLKHVNVRVHCAQRFHLR